MLTALKASGYEYGAVGATDLWERLLRRGPTDYGLWRLSPTTVAWLLLPGPAVALLWLPTTVA